MDARKFRDTVVKPDVEDLAQNYCDFRCAYHAVASVDALAAHIFVWCQKNHSAAVSGVEDDSDYRDRLAAQNPDFALLRDIAKARKHVQLTRGKPQVSRASDTSVRKLGWDEAKWGEGRWGSPPQVVVETNAGDFRPVETVVKAALQTLDAEMHRVGIL